MKAEEILRWTIPSPDDCCATAAQLRAEHPALTAEQLAWKAVKSARGWAALAGAASGSASTPLTMIPASLAETAYVLRREGHMAGVIAALLDPDSLNDAETFQADVLSVLFPGAVSQALSQFGVRGSQITTKSVVRRLMGRGFLGKLLRLIAHMLGIRITEHAILSKTLPIIGGGIGAAWNWAEVQAVGRRALRYHRESAVSAASASG
jgi:hypothetical protein